MNGGSVRIQKYIASCGLMSRRKAEEAVAAGRVSVNGVVVTEPGCKIVPGVDTVCVGGKRCEWQSNKIYLLLNKPEKVICTRSDPQGRTTVFDILPPHFRNGFHTVGRLDYMSCGLILICNDGDFTMKMTHPSSGIEKEYFVRTDKKIDENLLKNFQNGFSINEISYKIKAYRVLNSNEYTFVLTEGKNREIRKLLNQNHIGVKLLRRIRIGSVEIADLKPGDFRYLTSGEVDSLLETGVNGCSN